MSASRIVALATQVVSLPADPPAISPVGAGGIRSLDNVVVHVDTEDGVRGSAFAWVPSPRATGPPDADAAVFVTEAAVRHLAGVVVGEDVFGYQRIAARVGGLQRTLGRGLLATAHSVIDMAIWDAVCKLAGEPLHRLLGGLRDHVPAYNNELLGAFHRAPDQIAARAAELVAAGNPLLKLPLGPLDVEPAVERVAAVREAIGPRVGLAVDLGAQRGFEHALRLGRALEPYDLAWIEDPLSLDHVDQYAELRRVLATPIAAGETAYSHQTFRRLFEQRGLDFAIFEPMRIGGITGTLKLAGLADCFGVPIAAHVYPDLAAQLTAALPAGKIVEYVPWWAPLLQDPVQLVDGLVTPSPRPGIGLHFDPAALERYDVRAPA